MKTLFNTRTFWVGASALAAAGVMFLSGVCRAEAAMGMGLAGLLVLQLAAGLAGARGTVR